MSEAALLKVESAPRPWTSQAISVGAAAGLALLVAIAGLALEYRLARQSQTQAAALGAQLDDAQQAYEALQRAEAGLREEASAATAAYSASVASLTSQAAALGVQLDEARQMYGQSQEAETALRKRASDAALAYDERIASVGGEIGTYYNYSLFLKRFYLPSNAELLSHGYRIQQQNNPYLEQVARIRSMKKSATGLRELWRALRNTVMQPDYGRDDRQLVKDAMLVVSAFYDFGNPPPDDEKIGCVGSSAETGFRPLGRLTFDQYMQSDIGCCMDFALLLASFLDFLGFDNEIATSPAHQFLRVKLDGKWDLVDPTTRVYVQNYFSDGGEKIIESYAVGADRVYPFKEFFVKALAFEIETYAPTDWEIRSAEFQNLVDGSEHLTDLSNAGGL